MMSTVIEKFEVNDLVSYRDLITLLNELEYSVLRKEFKYGLRLKIIERDEAITLKGKIIPYKRFKELHLKVVIDRGTIDYFVPLEVTKLGEKMSEKEKNSLLESIQYSFNKVDNTHIEHYEEDVRMRYKENLLFQHYLKG